MFLRKRIFERTEAMGNTTSLQFDEVQRDKIDQYCSEIITIYVQYYLLSFKEVLVERKKKERAGFKQDITEKEAPPIVEKPTNDLVVDVVSALTLNSDFQPYTVYRITSSHGNHIVTTFRRYSEFIQLHKQLGRFAPINLPEKQISKNKNLSNDFIKERKEQLADYLHALKSDEITAQNEEFLSFLGFTPANEDSLLRQTFERTFLRTKNHFRIPETSNIIYNFENEGVRKLIIMVIMDDPFWKTTMDKLPTGIQNRKNVLKQINDNLNEMIDYYVQGSLLALHKALPELQNKIEPRLERELDDFERRLKIKLKELSRKRPFSEQRVFVNITHKEKTQKISYSNRSPPEAVRQAILTTFLLATDTLFTLSDNGVFYSIDATLPEGGNYNLQIINPNHVELET